jgi:glycosyltransferase involved in cell wall biosynthesis
MMDHQPNITFFVPRSRWGRWSLKPDWHPDVAQASVWIRGYQLSPYLESKGYVVACNQIEPLPDVGIFLRRYDRSDVALAKAIKARGGKVILDVVVNYFKSRPPTPYGYGGASDNLVASFLELLSLSDQVWTVSPYLQSVVKKYHPSAHFISDSVDPAHFIRPTMRSNKGNGPVILGWSGIASKAHSLEDISKVVHKYILDKVARVLVISNRKPKLSFPFIFKKWDYKSFPRLISQCDLCIAPRAIDQVYDLGHSIFKIGVFMALGIPALAGPIPAYSLLLDDHQAGEICDTEDAWADQLGRYLFDPTLREKAGINAKEKIKPYLTPNISDQVDKLIKNLYQ